MTPQHNVLRVLCICLLACTSGVGGFAPSIDIPATTTEPPPTTPDPATLPYFLHHINATNVTVSKGKTAILDCQVFRLRDRTVSWVRRQGDSIQLLTFGSSTYQTNGRYQLEIEDSNNWRLVVTAAEEADRGHYECQVSSHPPKIKQVNLFVYVPRLEIYDARGEAIQQKFYEVSSSIDLRCDAFYVPQDAVVWARGGAAIYHSPETGVSVETISGPQGPVSWLRIKAASTSDSGNYSCSAAEAEPTTVRIQVLEGDTSAAIQHSTNTSSSSHRAVHASVTTIIHLLSLSLVLRARGHLDGR
ncbi:hemicentin-2-like isoform X1 [Eriocheir sinensis]|uniref:hemicentin-2-like isoform X1 n=2 Tax=Eriocheir sinensis TaxID=95602 RepID=UPI0021C7F12F|nr:hemicentin-2-like isoform X1 [Eriocheir sinensis]